MLQARQSQIIPIDLSQDPSPGRNVLIVPEKSSQVKSYMTTLKLFGRPATIPSRAASPSPGWCSPASRTQGRDVVGADAAPGYVLRESLALPRLEARGIDGVDGGDVGEGGVGDVSEAAWSWP